MRRLLLLCALTLACSAPSKAGAPPPDALSGEDYAKLQAVLSRVEAAEARLRMAQMERDQLFGVLGARYQLGPQDSIGEGGKILRKPATKGKAP